MYTISGNGGETTWCFSQVKGTLEDDVTEADLISCVEFNHDGELLATGDKGGRVVIFQVDIILLHPLVITYSYSLYTAFRYPTTRLITASKQPGQLYNLILYFYKNLSSMAHNKSFFFTYLSSKNYTFLKNECWFNVAFLYIVKLLVVTKNSPSIHISILGIHK